MVKWSHPLISRLDFGMNSFCHFNKKNNETSLFMMNNVSRARIGLTKTELMIKADEKLIY